MGNRGFEVGGHAHRQFRQPVTGSAGGEPGEMGGRIGVGWRDAHQAGEGCPEARLAGIDKSVGLGTGDAALLRLLAGVDLDQQAWRATLSGNGVGDGVGEARAIEAFDRVGDTHCLGRLVGLQAADDVQTHGRMGGSQRREFVRGFLDAVFAECGLIGGECGDDGSRRMEF